jgi:hypothetical protein
MALRGSLRDFTISQLLNLINLANKSGVLVVEAPTDSAKLVFRTGKLSYAQIDREDNSLATVLFKAQKISPGQYHSIQQKAAGIPDKELGLLLINAGALSREDILVNLQQHFIDIVTRLFTWVEGFFHFENDVLPPENRISVQLDLENLIIEGTRQMREWEHLQDEIPSLDMALKFTDRPGANIRNLSLSMEEWRVISFINPHNSIRQIATATRKNDHDIRRIVYSFLQAGLVEIIRHPEVAVPNPAMRTFPTDDREEQRSLIHRLINRIRSL